MLRAIWPLLLPGVIFVNSALGGNDNRINFTGEFMQGGLVIGKVTPGSTVRFQGRKVRVSALGYFLIGFSRDAKSPAKLDVVYPNGQKLSKSLTVETRTYDVQRIDGLPPKQVSPSKKDLQRIQKEQALINAARKRDDARTDFLQTFIWPVSGRISGIYGSQRILNGEPRRPHAGLDIAAPKGTPVRAPASGVVSLTHDGMYFTGGTIILDHGHGLSTMYIHLNKIHVRKGERVEQGQVIGEVGMTGRATGPHLHWAMNLFNTKLDPKLLLPEKGEGTANNTTSP